jgi:transposase-like protein
VSEKSCHIDVLKSVPDPRQRLQMTQQFLEHLAAATKAARDVRDEAIVEMSTRGTGMHELRKISGMSRSHVQAMVRRSNGAE